MASTELDRLLASHPRGLAELHGTLCGYLCGGRAISDADVPAIAAQTQVFRGEAHADAIAGVRQLYLAAAAALRDDEYRFTPLLPADDQPLAGRIQALADWCQGYLSGLGRSGLAGDTPLSADVGTALRDLAAIAQADTAIEDEAQGEADLMELIEYVRMAVLLVFADVTASPGAAPMRH